MTESIYGPGERGPDLHVHREHTDAWLVLEGALTFSCATSWCSRRRRGRSWSFRRTSSTASRTRERSRLGSSTSMRRRAASASTCAGGTPRSTSTTRLPTVAPIRARCSFSEPSRQLRRYFLHGLGHARRGDHVRASRDLGASKMFGMPCLKRETGKVVAGHWKDGGMNVKLTDVAQREAALAISRCGALRPRHGPGDEGVGARARVAERPLARARRAGALAWGNPWLPREPPPSALATEQRTWPPGPQGRPPAVERAVAHCRKSFRMNGR